MNNTSIILNDESQNVAALPVIFINTVEQPVLNNPSSQARELLNLHESIGMINFEATQALALDSIDQVLDHFLPDGEMRGKNYAALNPTRNDQNIGSFMIDTESGMWKDFATDDKGGDLISLIKYVKRLDSQTDAAITLLKFIASGESVEDNQTIRTRLPSKEKGSFTSDFMPIFPIPNDAFFRKPTFSGGELGSPIFTWEYKNAEGQTLFYVNRFDTSKGKTFLPLTFGVDSSGFKSWRNKAPLAPRPAYGLDRLAARPDSPVIFTEGEKAADAAGRLFPDFVAVTTMNGAKSPEKTDFKPFTGRKVYIAPDNDEAGSGYSQKLISLLSAVGAEVIAVLKTADLCKDKTKFVGYDLADAEIEGWEPHELRGTECQYWEPILRQITMVTQPLHPLSKSEVETKPTILRSNKKKSDLEYAEDFALSYGDNVAVVNNQILAYQGGYWPALNIDYHVKRELVTMMGVFASASKVNSVAELIKMKYAATPESFERKSPLICLNNGTLNPITGEMLEHSVDHRLTNKLDIAFDPQATCPVWLQTLDEIFQPDEDKVEKIQLLQEFIGYCQIPDTSLQQFLWMVGAGGNGKSLILSVVTALIGKENISYAHLENLSEKFVRAELQGKLVNISSEMSSQATVSDGYLKQITAGDIIQAERKNERPFSFKPYARLIGATNSLPRLLDHSGGFFRRAMILRLNRQFSEAEQDKQREARILAELPGILNWALRGLQCVLQRGHYLIPDSCRSEAVQYRVNSDPVRQFSEEFLVNTSDKKDWVSSSEIYAKYKSWSAENGYSAVASNKFSDRLIEIGFKKEKRNSGKFWNATFYLASGAPEQPEIHRISSEASKYKL
jgi:putative DNA primase/helicase